MKVIRTIIWRENVFCPQYGDIQCPGGDSCLLWNKTKEEEKKNNSWGSESFQTTNILKMLSDNDFIIGLKLFELKFQDNTNCVKLTVFLCIKSRSYWGLNVEFSLNLLYEGDLVSITSSKLFQIEFTCLALRLHFTFIIF